MAKHGPTVDYFKGETNAYRKVLTWLEIDKTYPSTVLINKRIDITFTWGWLALLVAWCILWLL